MNNLIEYAYFHRGTQNQLKEVNQMGLEDSITQSSVAGFKTLRKGVSYLWKFLTNIRPTDSRIAPTGIYDHVAVRGLL